MRSPLGSRARDERDRGTEERSRDCIHPVLPFIGLHIEPVSIVIFRAEPDECLNLKTEKDVPLWEPLSST